MSNTIPAQNVNTGAVVDSNDIEAKVISIVAKRLEGKVNNPITKSNPVTKDTRITEDMNADSLDVIELIMSIEEKFAIEISEEDAQKMSTIGDIVQHVKSKLEQQ